VHPANIELPDMLQRSENSRQKVRRASFLESPGLAIRSHNCTGGIDVSILLVTLK